MTTNDIDFIRPLVERYPTATNNFQMDLALRIAEASPALLAEVDQLRAELDRFKLLHASLADACSTLHSAELEKVRAQLTAANHRADGAEADLRFAMKANTAYANEVAELRSELAAMTELRNDGLSREQQLRLALTDVARAARPGVAR